MFIVGILTKSQLSVYYASMGLSLWLEKMIPALLPFMILSGTMVRMGIAGKFAAVVHPVLGKLMKASRSACYVIFVGFLCGFPMGSRTVAELYGRGELTKREALWLLSFCNNIGPVYFCSFVLPLLRIEHPIPCILAMYGLPLLYGVFLRYTVYKKELLKPGRAEKQPMALAEALEDSIHSSVQGILMLGGYMILFCLLNLLPHMVKGSPLPLLSPFLEITSGLMALNGRLPVYCLIMLSFGGLSCLAQTYSTLQETDLKEHIAEYLLHKLVLSGLTILFYASWLLLAPESFY